MLTRISLLAWAVLSAAGVDAGRVINSENGAIPASSAAARRLMEKARRLDNANYNYNNNGNWDGEVDTSFMTAYDVKFQGCHHVQQWNSDAEDEDDVRIMTKRLVRFRLCPSGDCQSDLTGCTSRYGDYVVDMETYLSAYVEANNYNANQNYNYNDDQQAANEDGAEEQDQGGRRLQDISDYLECSQVNMRRKLDENGNGQNQYQDEDEDIDYYVGPYCADQGGEIRLGVFSDDTCSSFVSNGESKFYYANGYSLPYSDETMVSLSCMSCLSYGDNNGQYGVSDFCESIYQIAGKCETKMSIDYPNESACSYIEGIKIIREDGVIRTGATKKSKAAAIAIGVFLTIAVLLAGYVYYLRTKLGRAKINLAAASQTLT